MVGIESAKPAPGVIEAIESAEVIVLPPSNPIVSIGSILAVPGIREAITDSSATVVGISPIISGAPVRGMADACLQAEGIATTAEAVAAHYGPRAAGGLLDAWLVDTSDAASASAITASGIACRAVPLFMTDVHASREMARQAFDLVTELRGVDGSPG
jgi:LPPG:FO 2-phospho-L-lactate transferase